MSAAPTPEGPPVQAGLWSQLRSYNRIFWTCNTMEMFERLAYYGLRTVLPIYMVLSLEEGGPQFTHIQKGSIYAWWALVQSGLPVFTGGYADRYGYKLTVAVAIAVKMAGYLLMAYAVDLAGLLSGGESLTVPGHPATFWTFTAGALLLAAGTAIFKPGLQGIIGLQLRPENASVGWSAFYQIVNVGGWLGPMLAGVMRLLSWRYVFLSCAVIVAFNYVFLFTFPEPEAHPTAKGEPRANPLKVLWDSAIGICEPRLMAFLVVFSGFWAMFHQLFDLLPNYIEDWVDTRDVAAQLAAPLFGVVGAELPASWGGRLPQEHMINLNAGMCMLLAFFIGYLTGKVRSMTAMIAGILVATSAIYSLGLSDSGWLTLGAIALFSLGELMSSPTKMRYFSNIAPPGKKGLYLGYINATGGIGWFLGSLIAGELYETRGDKVVLARKFLIEERGLDATEVMAMAKTTVLPKITALTGQDPEAIRVMLLDMYAPSFVWAHFAMIGFIAMVGLIVFDRITQAKLKAEPYLLLALTTAVSSYTYGLKAGVFFTLCITAYLAVERTRPQWLPQGQTEA